MPASVTRIPPAPRPDQIVASLRLGICIRCRMGWTFVIDVLGRWPPRRFETAHSARLYAARNWPRAIWDEFVEGSVTVLFVKRCAKPYEFDDLC